MEFIDLKAQFEQISAEIDSRVKAVLEHGAYILGPEVSELEDQLADYLKVSHCITCANGTDALQLALMALGVGAGDTVLCPSFTFAATAEAVALVGATPMFVDIDSRSFNICNSSLKRTIDSARGEGRRLKAIIAVDLFGAPADYDHIQATADQNGLDLICDNAQGFGATYKGRRTGAYGRVTTTSFFPAKPLGCFGDGGALFTNDAELAKKLASLRVHGKGIDKYDNVCIGMNSRLDTIQAAILLAKLPIYEVELKKRRFIADRYSKALSSILTVPSIEQEVESVWAQYTVMAENEQERAKFISALSAGNVPTAIYYSRPVHLQNAYSSCPRDPAGLASTEEVAQRVFSLPMHPYLMEEDVDHVVASAMNAVDGGRIVRKNS